MAPNRSTRPTRDGEIPDNFIVNWRKSEAHGSDGASNAKPTPSVRRPITACENCRTAKVRCNGRKNCQRCTTRALVCTYRTSSPASERRSPPGVDDGSRVTLSPAFSSSSTMQMTGPAVTQPLPSTTHMGATNTTAPPYVDNTVPRPGVDLETMAPASWTGGPQHHNINQLDWTGMLDPTVNGQTLGCLPPSFPLDWDALESMVNSATHHHVYPRDRHSNNALFGNNSQSASSASASPPASGLQQTLHSYQQASPSSSSCPCRASLMLCVPKITSAMREKRLDEILKVTGEVTKYCQEILDCTTNEVRCSDLLLIMSVLQETNPCFDYIAKDEGSGDGAAIKLSFGGYEVTSNSMSFRAAMILDLVQRARAVVSAISAKGQSMIDELPEPSDLAKANIAYLEATINHYRKMLNCVACYIDDAMSKYINGCGGSGSAAPAPSLSPSRSTTSAS